MGGTTFQEFMRIASVAGVQPDMVIAAHLFDTTPPEHVHIMISDNVAYITEKR